jgi:hypothetical protein
MNGGYVIDKSEFVILLNQRLKYLKERKRVSWAGISERAPELRRHQNMLGDIFREDAFISPRSCIRITSVALIQMIRHAPACTRMMRCA